MIADVLVRAFGVAIFLTLLALGLTALVRSARRSRIERPVLIGLGLRLAVAAGAHAASVLSGNGGFFYLDDRYYARVGDALAAAWSHGQLPNPARAEFAGSYSYGYSVLVGLTDLFTGAPVLAGKAVNVLLGGVVILLAARVATRLLGAAAGERTAWLVAVLPTLVWWSSPLLKEQLAACLFLALVLAATGESRPNGLALAVPAAVLGIVRPPALLAATMGVAASRLVRTQRRSVSERWFVAAVVTGAALVTLTLLAGGRPAVAIEQIGRSIGRLIAMYDGGGSSRLPLDMLRSIAGPYPWVFRDVEVNWDMALYPGNWVLICLYPTVVLGAWRLWRRHRQALLLVATPIAVLIAVNAFTSGTVVRQRSTIEPLLAIIAVAGWTSGQAVAARASLALLVTAPLAAVQSRSALVGVLVAMAGLVLLVSSRRLASNGVPLAPSAPFGPTITPEGLTALVISIPARGRALVASRPAVSQRPSGLISAVVPGVAALGAAGPDIVALRPRGASPASLIGVLRTTRVVLLDSLAVLRGVSPAPAPLGGGHRFVPDVRWRPREALLALRRAHGRLAALAPPPRTVAGARGVSAARALNAVTASLAAVAVLRAAGPVPGRLLAPWGTGPRGAGVMRGVVGRSPSVSAALPPAMVRERARAAIHVVVGMVRHVTRLGGFASAGVRAVPRRVGAGACVLLTAARDIREWLVGLAPPPSDVSAAARRLSAFMEPVAVRRTAVPVRPSVPKAFGSVLTAVLRRIVGQSPSVSPALPPGMVRGRVRAVRVVVGIIRLVARLGGFVSGRVRAAARGVGARARMLLAAVRNVRDCLVGLAPLPRDASTVAGRLSGCVEPVTMLRAAVPVPGRLSMPKAFGSVVVAVLRRIVGRSPSVRAAQAPATGLRVHKWLARLAPPSARVEEHPAPRGDGRHVPPG